MDHRAPGAQVLDVTHSLHFLVERGSDSRGMSGVASAAIRQFYDHLCVGGIGKWLLDKNYNCSEFEAILRP